MAGLEKYPVTTDEGSYSVEVHQKYVCLGMYQWVVKIYVKNEKKTFFNRKGFKKVYEYETGWSSFREHALDLVGLAKMAVRHYEEEVIVFTRKFDAAIEDFESWDGTVR